MVARLEQPTPCATAQKLNMDALLVPPSHRAPSSAASPHPHSLSSVARSLSLPTPSPSPSLASDTSSTSSASRMLSFDAQQSQVFDPVLRRFNQLSLNTPTTPRGSNTMFQHQNSGFVKTERQRPTPLFCPTPPTEFLPHLDPIIDLQYDYGDVEQCSVTTGSSRRYLQEEFRRTKSRVVRVYNLPRSSIAADHILTRHFASPSLSSSPSSALDLTTPTSTSPPHSSSTTAAALLDLANVRMWSLREEFGGPRMGEEDAVWMVFQSHAEACTALSLPGALSVAPALENDLEPFEKLRKYEVKNVYSQSTLPSQGMYGDRLPPSPTSPDFSTMLLQLPDAQSGYQFSRSPNPWQQNYQLSSNPPNPRSVFRQGDWICASPNCAAHNFGRNVVCIGCGSPRILSDTQPHMSDTNNSNAAFSMRMASPRFAAPSMTPSPSPSALAYTNNIQAATPLFLQQQLPSKQTPQTHQLLTPSGRALAVGGKVQNVSRDPLAPCIVYWPDNEPLPEQGQIRPPAAGQVHQPPIMNTGNKGPIEHQPGDWICHKCDYLNWRRRKVCQTCYPYAEGNGDSVNAAMQAERLAYLAAIFAQSQAPQLNAPSPIPSPNAHALHQQFPRSSASAASTSIPFPSNANFAAAQRSPFIPAQNRFAAANGVGASSPSSRMSNQAFARRSNSTPEMPSGNVVYQTPVSPSRATYPVIGEGRPAANEQQTGHFLPSFLKNEIKPVPTRSPLSLSPSSSSSAELSYDEYDDDLNSPASVLGASSTFYAQQQKTGSGKLSSGSGSSSSLTLGGSIWALDRSEDKTWNPVAMPSPDFLTGARSRKTSMEPFKNM